MSVGRDFYIVFRINEHFSDLKEDVDSLGHRMGILGCSTAEMKISSGC